MNLRLSIFASIPDPPALAPLSEHEATAVAYGLAHLRVVAFIELHLFEDLDLGRVAAVAGYSVSEFSRRFTRLQGESVMAYVRGRRLETAASRILADPAARLLDLAIECGFDSQAAFTRAFGRAFGVAPGELRGRSGGDGGVTTPPPRRRRTRTPSPTLAQRLEFSPELALVGLRKRFTPANYVEMAGLWEQLVGLRGSRRDESFGVFLAREPGGVLEFFAATRARADLGAPLVPLTLPAGHYLVLRQHLRDAPLLAQMTAADEALARYTRPTGWDFQRYPADFAVANGWIDHWLPLVASTPTW